LRVLNSASIEKHGDLLTLLGYKYVLNHLMTCVKTSSSLFGFESSSDLYLKRDLHSEFSTLTGLEAESDVVDSVTSFNVVEDCEWDLNLILLLGLNDHINRSMVKLDWDYIISLLISQCKGATLFPWPEGIVKDLNCSKSLLSCSYLNDAFWFLDNNCSLLHVVSCLVGFGEVFVKVLLNIIRLCTHLLNEISNECFHFWVNLLNHFVLFVTISTSCFGDDVGEELHLILEIVLLSIAGFLILIE